MKLHEFHVLQRQAGRNTMALPSPVQVCAEVQEKYARP
jgi:hypothetical protein